MAINRYGKCPNTNCNCEWDGGDILDNLRTVKALSNKSEKELVNLAFNAYGYQKSAPKNFSTVVTIQIIDNRVKNDSLIYIMCPNCRKVYNIETGKEYRSLLNIKKRINDKLNGTEIPKGIEEETVE